MQKKAFLTTLPDFVEIQRASFCWFLEKGLSEELEKFSSINDLYNNIELNFFGQEYKIRKPKYSIVESKYRDTTYAVRIYVPMSINIAQKPVDIDKTHVFIGELPLMSDRGTFIINGCERVIINQIIRSPGIYYKQEKIKRSNSLFTYNATLIPSRGSWLKFEIDKKQSLNISIDKTDKIKILNFFKILDISIEEILSNLTYPEFLKDKISEENKNKETQEIETLFDDDDEKLEIHELFDNRIFNPKYYDL